MMAHGSWGRRLLNGEPVTLERSWPREGKLSFSYGRRSRLCSTRYYAVNVFDAVAPSFCFPTFLA